MVENLDGSARAKRRLEVVLETVAGKKDVEEACAELGIGKTAFYELRKKVLQAALEDMEPKPAGRPAKGRSMEQEHIEQLQDEVEDLRAKLKIADVREELLLSMPEVFDPAKESQKKKEKSIQEKRSKTKKKRQWKKQERRKQRKKRR